MDVLLVAAKTELINDYMSVVRDAGLVPRIVDIDSLAAGNAFELTHPVSQEQVPMVVNVGASFMNINILHAGVPLFTATSHGRRDVHLGDPEAAGRRIRDGRGVQDRQEGPRGAGGEALRNHEDGLHPARHGSPAVVQLLLRTYPDRLVTKVYLTGGAARSTFLKEILAEKIGVDVEIFDPTQGLSVDEKTVDPAVVSQFNTAATVSIGLALRNLEARG